MAGPQTTRSEQIKLPITISRDDLYVTLYRSKKDGILVVEIQGPSEEEDLTPEGLPKLRVWLNEEEIYNHNDQIY